MHARPNTRWKGTRFVRNFSIGGALVGALSTVAIQSIMELCDTADTMIGWLMLCPWLAIYEPGRGVWRSLGYNWQAYGGHVTWQMFGFMLLTNSAVLALAGALLGLMAAGASLVSDRPRK